jgi:hypothetical protein
LGRSSSQATIGDGSGARPGVTGPMRSGHIAQVTISCGLPTASLTCGPYDLGPTTRMCGGDFDRYVGLMFLLARSAALLVAVIGCTADAAQSPTAAPPPSAPAATASRGAAMSYEPGPNSPSGRVTRLVSDGVVLQTMDGELAVDLAGVRSVWKESEVSSSDLEVGDQLDLNGLRGPTSFQARYVWANIGRFDGIVRAVSGDRLELVALPPSTRTFQVHLSPHLIVVRNADIPATVADLQPGMSIGGVMYRPRNGTPRATKIWF